MNREDSDPDWLDIAPARHDPRPDDAPLNPTLTSEALAGQEAEPEVDIRHRAINIAIIGAGWAGLSAATTLREAGAQVTVYEVGQIPGGRARHVESDTATPGVPLDNGQHILLGSYTQTLALMRRLDRDPDKLLHRQPLTIESVEGSLHLKAPRWPAPWHGVAALLSAKGLGWRDRYQALRGIMRLSDRNWRTHPEQTVLQLMRELQQTAHVVRYVWEPLCRAALNTPMEYASSQIFARVLRDSLGGESDAADLLIPKVDLSALWPNAAASRCTMRYGHTVQRLEIHPTSVEVEFVLGGEVDSARHDAVIIAVPPGIAQRLVEPLPESSRLCKQLGAFRFLPIATLTLRLAGPYRLPQPMMMLYEDIKRGYVGQWVFDRGALLGVEASAEQGELSIVVSAREVVATTSRETLSNLLQSQLAEQLARRPGMPPLPAVLSSELIVEKRATFAAVTKLERPGISTPWPRIVLAGDWTDTGYPAVLEGAVRSGTRAANTLAARFN